MRLPTSWVTAPIGEVTSDCAQKIPVAGENFQYIDITSVDRESKKIVSPQYLLGRDAPSRARKLVRTGDVLVSMTRPNLNAVALVPEALDGQVASTGFDVLRAIELDPRWIFYLVRTRSFVERMAELVQGALYPAVRPRDVRGYEAPVAPLNEQKRIADKLDALLARVDACRERLDRVSTILKRFRQSVLAAATSSKLTEEWRNEHYAASSDATEWEPLTLGQLCQNSFYGPRFGKNEYTDSDAGVPTIRTTDMTIDGRIDITAGTPRVIVSENKIEHFRVRKGDLLITRTGSIGVMAVFEGDYVAIPSAYLIRFRFSAQILPRYVFFCLMAPLGQEQLGLSTTAITQPNINAEAIKRIEIQLPSLDEQLQIVSRVDTLLNYADSVEARYAAARSQVERLTPAFLAKAFRGELVPQDHNDEPASVLLEHIRTTRAVTPAKSKRKGAGRTNKSPKTDEIPKGVHATLKDSATNRRSLNSKHLAGVKRSVSAPKVAPARLARDLKAFADRLPRVDHRIGDRHKRKGLK